MTRPADSLYFDCGPLHAPIMRVEACRDYRKRWSMVRTKAIVGRTDGSGGLPPVACEDCELAVYLEGGRIETKTLEEITRGIDATPPPERAKWVPRAEHSKARAPEGAFVESEVSTSPVVESESENIDDKPNEEEPEGHETPSTEGKGMTKRDQIVAWVGENPGSTLAEIVEGTGLTYNVVSGAMTKLKNAKRLVGEKELTRPTRYNVPDDAEVAAALTGAPPAEVPVAAETQVDQAAAEGANGGEEPKGKWVKQIKRSVPAETGEFKPDVLLLQDIGRALGQQIRGHLEGRGDRIGVEMLNCMESNIKLLERLHEDLNG